MAAPNVGAGFPDVVVPAAASTTALAPDAEQTWQELLAGRSPRPISSLSRSARPVEHQLTPSQSTFPV